jgi:hypothetical protein
VRSGTSAWPKISQKFLDHVELILDHAELGAPPKRRVPAQQDLKKVQQDLKVF